VVAPSPEIAADRDDIVTIMETLVDIRVKLTDAHRFLPDRG
jgi:hypothetical protein